MDLVKRLKKRIGANGPGLTVAVIAMLVALTGGAFAASGALNATQKKEVKKIAQAEAKKFAGKPGAQGPAGPQGSAGVPGAKGDKGDVGEKGLKGDPGIKGEKGVDGNDGKSIEVTPIAPGIALECEERGGILVKVEGAPSGEEVCNGAKGEKGEKGEPWTPNNTLPSGAMETGTWAFAGTTADTSGIRVPISFPVQMAAVTTAEHTHFSTEESFAASCEGSAAAPNPKAGELCVYLNPGESLENTSFEGIFRISALNLKGANRAGAVLYFAAPSGAALASGSFAVRAP